MDCSHIVSAIIGFSASLFLCLPKLKNWQLKRITKEKLRIVSEVLEQAEERVTRYEERHDRILSQICSHYMINQDLQEALAGARIDMNGALEFAVGLRKLQMEIISSYPFEEMFRV